jgi:hypothetical protein
VFTFSVCAGAPAAINNAAAVNAERTAVLNLTRGAKPATRSGNLLILIYLTILMNEFDRTHSALPT